MSLPINSRAISSIDTSTFYYLYDLDEIDESYSNSKWLGLGGPKKNISMGYLHEDVIYTITDSIKNRSLVANPNDFFVDFPSVLSSGTTKGDISIGSTPTNIYLTFIDEHAGYTNAVGYYFYIIDGNGDKQLIDNIDNTDAPSYSNGYYRPTILFPNASQIGKSDNFAQDKKQDHGQLKCGDKRQLKGNNSDYTFQNINIGFFLVPDGWTTVLAGVVFNSSLPILHTTPEFNSNYVDGSVNQDENGIQSVVYDIDSNYILGFEDIERPSTGDQDPDFNDVLFAITADQSLGITGASVTKLTTPDKLVKVNKCGTDLKVKSNLINENDTSKKYRFDHFINIGTADETTRLKNAMDNLTIEYTPIITQPTSIQIKLVYNLSQADMVASLQDDEYRVNIFNKLSNLDDITIAGNGKTAFDNMVEYQHIYLNNDNLVEDYYLYSTDLDGSNETLIQSEVNTNPVRLISGALIWGDPHIETMFGETFLLPHIEGLYVFFKNNYMTILTELWKPPSLSNHHIKEIRESTFIRNAQIYYHHSFLKIDMDTLEVLNAYGNDITITDIKEDYDTVYNTKKTIVKNKEISLGKIKILCQIYPNYFDEIRNMITLSKYDAMDMKGAKGMSVRRSDIIMVPN